MSMPTLMGAFQRAARCLACDRKPEMVSQVVYPASNDIDIVFWCHGSKETIRVKPEVFRFQEYGHVIRRSTQLFREHANPDMRELLQYNREPWRS